jgi:hypothetical protein
MKNIVNSLRVVGIQNWIVDVRWCVIPKRVAGFTAWLSFVEGREEK